MFHAAQLIADDAHPADGAVISRHEITQRIGPVVHVFSVVDRSVAVGDEVAELQHDAREIGVRAR
jgi:hypothetical protein